MDGGREVFMKRELRGPLLIGAATVVLAACAASAPTRPAGTTAASTTTTTTTAAGATAAAGTGPALAAYKRVVRNGQTLYCKKEIPTGTRFVEETCLTQAQMDAQSKNAQNFTDDVHGMAVLPPTSPNVR
jgi:hypothetical protein